MDEGQYFVKEFNESRKLSREDSAISELSFSTTSSSGIAQFSYHDRENNTYFRNECINEPISLKDWEISDLETPVEYRTSNANSSSSIVFHKRNQRLDSAFWEGEESQKLEFLDPNELNQVDQDAGFVFIGLQTSSAVTRRTPNDTNSNGFENISIDLPQTVKIDLTNNSTEAGCSYKRTCLPGIHLKGNVVTNNIMSNFDSPSEGSRSPVGRIKGCQPEYSTNRKMVSGNSEGSVNKPIRMGKSINLNTSGSFHIEKAVSAPSSPFDEVPGFNFSSLKRKSSSRKSKRASSSSRRDKRERASMTRSDSTSYELDLKVKANGNINRREKNRDDWILFDDDLKDKSINGDAFDDLKGDVQDHCDSEENMKGQPSDQGYQETDLESNSIPNSISSKHHPLKSDKDSYGVGPINHNSDKLDSPNGWDEEVVRSVESKYIKQPNNLSDGQMGNILNQDNNIGNSKNEDMIKLFNLTVNPRLDSLPFPNVHTMSPVLKPEDDQVVMCGDKLHLASSTEPKELINITSSDSHQSHTVINKDNQDVILDTTTVELSELTLTENSSSQLCVNQVVSYSVAPDTNGFKCSMNEPDQVKPFKTVVDGSINDTQHNLLRNGSSTYSETFPTYKEEEKHPSHHIDKITELSNDLQNEITPKIIPDVLSETVLDDYPPAPATDNWTFWYKDCKGVKLLRRGVWVPVNVKVENAAITVCGVQSNDVAFKEIPLLPFFAFNTPSLKEVEKQNKIHVVKLQYIKYKETRKYGRKTSVHHIPEYTSILKLGSKDCSYLRSFMDLVNSKIRLIPIHRDKGISYEYEEIFVNSDDICQFLLSGDGNILKCNITVQLQMKVFLSGAPYLQLYINDDSKISGNDTGGKVNDFVKLHNLEYHPCVDIEKSKGKGCLYFLPPDGCQFEVLRFRVQNFKELPVFVKSSLDLASNNSIKIKAEIKAGSSERLGKCTCYNVIMHFPIPKEWMSIFRKSSDINGKKQFMSASANPTTLTPGTCRGKCCAIRVSLGSVTIQPEFGAVVWRIGNLPFLHQSLALDAVHTFSCHLELPFEIQLPDDFAPFAEVEFSSPCSLGSEVVVKDIVVSSGVKPDQWIHYNARYTYKVLHKVLKYGKVIHSNN